MTFNDCKVFDDGLGQNILEMFVFWSLYFFFGELHTLSGLAIHNNSNNVGNCKIHSLTYQL